MEKERVFTVSWDFYPKTSGESTVSRRSLIHSKYNYDVVSGYFGKGAYKENNISVYPTKGEKYFFFTLKTLQLFFKLNRVNKYKILYTRVHPVNGHFAGCLIKCLFPKLKWIVYFSDPVWNSPFIRPFNAFRKDKNARPRYIVMKTMGIFSKLAIHMGDILVFNNVRLAKFILGDGFDKYSDKIVIVPYGHDGLKENNQKVKLKENKFCFAHVGQLYGERNLYNTIEALKVLRTDRNDYFKKISIILVGEIDEYNKNLINQNEMQDIFEIIGLVDYEKSLYYMSNADCLLVIDTDFNDQNHNIYTPSKLFDYMATCNLILAISSENTATTDLTIPAKILTVKHEGADICKAIVAIIDGEVEVDLKAYEVFECKQYVKMLDDRIDQLISSKPSSTTSIT